MDTRPNLPSDVQSSAYAVGLAWLDFDVPLLPLQPGSKFLVKGFGPLRRQITELDKCHYYCAIRRCNLGLATGGRSGLVVLDVDSQAAYADLVHHWPILSATFTIRTKDGYHVYLRTTSVVRSGKVGDVEVKAAGGCVTTWPSFVAGHTYTPLDVQASILEIDPAHFPSLSAPRRQMDKPLGRERVGPCGDLVSRIKAAWSIVDIGEGMTLLQTSDRRWFRGRCPSGSHKDTHASFWLDSDRGTFGCHACDFHGDTINLFAFRHKLTVQDAIAEMAKRLSVGGAA